MTAQEIRDLEQQVDKLKTEGCALHGYLYEEIKSMRRKVDKLSVKVYTASGAVALLILFKDWIIKHV